MAHLSPQEVRLKFQQRLFLTLGLRRKPLRLFCENCGKFIPSDMPWRCAFCDTENYRTKRYSFLYKCEECKRPPTSFHCPHCNEVFAFAGAENGSHAAKKIESPKETEDEVRARRVREQAALKSELHEEVIITRLNTDLAEARKKLEAIVTKKSAREELEESFAEHDTYAMAAHEIARRQKEANKIKFAGDPYLLQKANESVDAWLDKQA